jgi:hypothetical protein
MAIELEKAMRARAQQRVNEGIAPRDPVAGGLRLYEPEPFPRLLVALIILCAVVVVTGLAWEIAQVPPAHILIVAIVVGFGVLRLRRRRR